MNGLQSVILNRIKKTAEKTVSLFGESFTGKAFEGLNRGIDSGIDNSSIVRFFTKPENSDVYYERIAAGTVGKVMLFLNKIFGFLSKGIRKSVIYCFLKYVCENFFTLPLLCFGIIPLIAGVGTALGSVVLDRGRASLIISLALCVVGIILMLFKKSLSELFGGSVIFGGILKLFKTPQISPRTKSDVSKAGFVAAGVLYAVVGAAFGVYPLVCAVILTIGAAFAFYKTGVCVVITAGVLPFMPTMVMVALCLMIAAVIFAKAVLSFRDGFESYSCVQNIFVMFMCIACAISAVFSVAFSSSLKIVMVYLAFMSFYFSFVKTIKGKKGILSVLYTLVVTSLPVAIYGIYQKIVGFDEQNTWIDTEMFENISGRVVSTFENPNVFGEYLIVAIMLCIAAMVIVKSKRYKAFYAVTLVCLAASMVFTYSRGCWIGIVCAVAIYLFMTNRKLFWTAAVLGVISLFFLPESITGRLASVGNMSDSSTSYRVYIWMGTLRLLKDYWFIGIGQGSDAFNIIYPAYSYSAIEAPHAHNLYLLIMTELGVLGAAAFIGVIFVFFRKMFYVVKNSAVKEYKILSAAISSAMGGFLVQGMFDNVWYNYRVFLFFWMIVAFGISVYIADKKREDRGKFYR